jgi:putative AbiEii toxin of type IV toxin-antitoxin system/RloB-like protein
MAVCISSGQKSAAAQNNHQALFPVYDWITKLQFVITDRALYQKVTAALCTAADFLAEVETLVSVADLGISGVKVEEAQRSDKTKKLIWPQIHLVHRLGDREALFSTEQESHGTLAYLALLGPVVYALKNGEPLCVDELDGSLHPLLSIQLIRLFNNPETNPKGAQLIFNTHDTNLLSSGILRRDQIWFTEKKDDGSSHLFPLSDFKPRRTENLENGYRKADTEQSPSLTRMPSYLGLRIGMPRGDDLRRRRPLRSPLPRILIVCEGTRTEPGYFNELRHTERIPIELVISPGGVPKNVCGASGRVEKPAQKDAKTRQNQTLRYEDVWCVFDIDEHPAVSDAKQQAR